MICKCRREQAASWVVGTDSGRQGWSQQPLLRGDPLPLRSGARGPGATGAAGDNAERQRAQWGPWVPVLAGQGEARGHLGLSSCPRIDFPVPPLGDDLSKGSRDTPGHQQPVGALSPALQCLPVQGLAARCCFGPCVIPDPQLGELCQTDQKALRHRPILGCLR